MVAPINYLAQVANPFESAVAGLKLGGAIQEQQLKQQVIQQEMANRQALAQEQAKFFSNPKPSMRDAARFISMLPKEQAEAVKPFLEGIAKETQQGVLKFNARVLSALENNPSVGIQLLKERAEAERSAGDVEEADFYARIAESAEKQGPQTAFKALTRVVASLPGAKDMFDAAAKASPTESQGYEILTPEQVKQLGLPSGATYQRNVDTKKVELLGGGGERFEILAPSQAAALGLPKNATYQRDATSGKITAVGPGGVTVNMPPQIGSIPPGYRVVYDANRLPVSMEVIPGSPEERKIQEAQQKGAAAAESTITASTIVLDEVKSLRNMVKNQKTADPVTGTLGAIVGEKGGVLKAGSARATAEERIKTIKANIGFDRLNQMRQESPTGGALGNITEQELAFLQSVLGSIDLNQKDEAILANLKRLENIYNGILKKAQAYPNADKYGFGKARATAPAANSVTVGNQTYTRPAGFTDEQWNAYVQEAQKGFKK